MKFLLGLIIGIIITVFSALHYSQPKPLPSDLVSMDKDRIIEVVDESGTLETVGRGLDDYVNDSIIGIGELGGYMSDKLAREIAASKNVNCLHTADNFKCAVLVSVYDGDSITVNIPNLHHLFGNNAKIRIAGVDTPEMRTSDTCEKTLAVKAKEFTLKALKNAKNIELSEVERGKYFGIVANVLVDGKSLGAKLLENKFGYPYYGGTKEKIDWCNFQG